jgi:hypothetical protein
MAHPYAGHKQNAVGKRRANKLVRGNEYASGGSVAGIRAVENLRRSVGASPTPTGSKATDSALQAIDEALKLAPRPTRAEGGPVKSTKSWGNQGNAPMPINIEGAAYNIRRGTASGKVDTGGPVNYGLSGDWKAK